MVFDKLVRYIWYDNDFIFIIGNNGIYQLFGCSIVKIKVVVVDICIDVICLEDFIVVDLFGEGDGNFVVWVKYLICWLWCFKNFRWVCFFLAFDYFGNIWIQRVVEILSNSLYFVWAVYQFSYILLYNFKDRGVCKF